MSWNDVAEHVRSKAVQQVHDLAGLHRVLARLP